ncbi:MAG: TIGR04255 family protein [Hydrotalea sp.]|nr:TIGR04255 family protein [Hydrotalea sp.]
MKEIKMAQHPKRLKILPLVDAVFEIRFRHPFKAYQAIVGTIYNNVDSEYKNKEIINTNESVLPKPVRDSQPQFEYAMLNIISLDGIFIGVGEKALNLVAKYPYPGWDVFKQKIFKVLDILQEGTDDTSINRFSLKYIDVIDNSRLINPSNHLDSLKIQLNILEQNYQKDIFHFIITTKDEKNHAISTILNLSAPAEVKINGEATYEATNGIRIDIDVIKNVEEDLTIRSLLTTIKNQDSVLDEMHIKVKNLFFNILDAKVIKNHDPE